jgi:hypothetical protein
MWKGLDIYNEGTKKLFQNNASNEAVALTDEQKGFLYLLLKTVIDVLDQPGIG